MGWSRPLIIAPHIEGEVFCPAAADNPEVKTDEQAWALCAARHETSAARLAGFLDTLQPKPSASGQFALGYTLTIPVMGLFVRSGDAWRIDPDRIDSLVDLIAAVDRPTVLYLSANHFIDSGEAFAAALAADTRNLMWTRNGPLKLGGYFSVGLQAWSLADPGAPITRYREAAFAAVLEHVCRLPAASRARIVGVNVLGEVHQLFSGFPDRMGYSDAFDITDYSPASIAGFREFLRKKFTTVGALDAATGFAFKSFDEIEAPAHDIHHETLRGFAQHIDAYASGELVFQGWAYDDHGGALTVQLWMDGAKVAEAPAWLNRLDVSDAVPGLRSPNVGWKIDFDYRHVPFGIHVFDVAVVAANHAAVRLGQRHIVVDNRHQDTPPPNDFAGVPAGAPGSWPGLHGYIDSPADWTSLFHNPLAELWRDWRGEQVRRHIAHFAGMVNASCLGPGLAFSHQINPGLNSSWNAELLATGASELATTAYHPGTTLYGGAAFGDAFFTGLAAAGWQDYALTELNPLFGLSPEQMAAMLERYRMTQARYIQPYYMSIKPDRLLADTNELSRRRLRAGSAFKGAGAFFEAIRRAVNAH